MQRDRHKLTSLLSVFFAALILIISCSQIPQSSNLNAPANFDPDEPIIIGYSNWVGWWPWEIAELEELFAKNNINVQMKWYESYLESLEALAAGQIDGNCQTLNDTIAFAPNAVNGEVIILVNDNSAGNDKIIVAENIDTVEDLKGKKVAVEEGIVTDFLLNLALESKGMKRDDVEIVPLETSAAAAVFTSKQVNAVSVFAPFWLTALEREGSKELISSKEFPGSIPDLLVVSQKLIMNRQNVAQGLIDTWFDILDFIEQNPQKADEIMAARAEVTLDELKLFQEGTKIFTVADNLRAFGNGETMQHLPFAAQKISNFMLDVGFIPEVPDLSKIFDDRFIQTYARQL